MAAFVLTDFSFVIDNSGGTPVDLSDHVMSATLNIEVDLQEDTVMGATGNYKTRLAGLKDWSVDITLKQDFAASKVDATFFPDLGASGTFTGKPTSGGVSATNPSYSGECILESYPPIGNAMGELATVVARFAGNGALTRATS